MGLWLGLGWDELLAVLRRVGWMWWVLEDESPIILVRVRARGRGRGRVRVMGIRLGG